MTKKAVTTYPSIEASWVPATWALERGGKVVFLSPHEEALMRVLTTGIGRMDDFMSASGASRWAAQRALQTARKKVATIGLQIARRTPAGVEPYYILTAARR